MSLKSLTAALVPTVIGAALLFVSYSRPGASSLLTPEVTDSRVNQVEGRVEAELLVLHSAGFQPNEIRRPPGRFILALQNHSSEEEISLVLRQEIGPSQASTTMTHSID